MNYNIQTIPEFEKNIKQLNKKYKNKNIYLLNIYSKSEQSTISNTKLNELLKEIK